MARSLETRLRQLEMKQSRSRQRCHLSAYSDDPVGYAERVLRIQWWDKQKEIAEGLVNPPYRVLAKAAHGVGKSHVAGGLVNWWYDSFVPGVCLTTAPTDRQVKDILWKEVRRQRCHPGDFPGPKIPRLESAPDHFAHGFTARDSTSFQGQHEEHVLIIFDEAVGVGREFWDSAESMLQGPRCAMLAIYNPTDPTSWAWQAEQEARKNGSWKIVEIPAISHPNISAELSGLPPVYPKAIRLAWLSERIKRWCEPILQADRIATDLEWPPASGNWFRPGPLAQARLLASWPTAASGVWSESLWRAAESEIEVAANVMPHIGCDVARFGDDWTEIHVRIGWVSVHHESHNGWDTAKTASRLRELAVEYARFVDSLRPSQAERVDPRTVPIKIDDAGVGGGVVDQSEGFSFVGVSAAGTPNDSESYPNIRSELWFSTAERAKEGRVSFARIPAEIRSELRRQAMSPEWRLDASGRRVVEPKEDTKEKLGRSPDGMDAVNLAYYSAADMAPQLIESTRPPRGRRGFR